MLLFVANCTLVHFSITFRILVIGRYCKRLNFREDLFFAKNRSHEQFGQYVNATEATLDL
ncbi:MAG: hypothetical protein PV344_04250 [Anaplasma sp.]|nr:hypothetical protein [Anaplasma sp.]